MSQIPGPSRLKAPSKIVKPVQGGSGSSIASPGVVKPRSGIPAKPDAGTVKPRQPSGRKTSTEGNTTEVVRRGSSTSSLVSNGSEKGSRLMSPRGSLTPKQGISRENSASRLQYRRESSSSSLRGDKSKPPLSVKREPSQGSIVKRRTSAATQDSADLLSLYKLGDRVLVGDSKTGVIAYIGGTRFAKGDWVGVVLDEAIGKNDGSVAGVRYFECEPLHGVFSKVEKITKINQIVSGKPQATARTELNVGDRVVVSGTKHGVVRFLGETGFAKGEWVGVELDEPLGKNDGAVAGTRWVKWFVFTFLSLVYCSI